MTVYIFVSCRETSPPKMQVFLLYILIALSIDRSIHSVQSFIHLPAVEEKSGEGEEGVVDRMEGEKEGVEGR